MFRLFKAIFFLLHQVVLVWKSKSLRIKFGCGFSWQLLTTVFSALEKGKGVCSLTAFASEMCSVTVTGIYF